MSRGARANSVQTDSTGAAMTRAKRSAPTDFLNIDSLLSDEEILIRATVGEYVEAEIVPNVGCVIGDKEFR